jgi:hypothetical protein
MLPTLLLLLLLGQSLLILFSWLLLKNQDRQSLELWLLGLVGWIGAPVL